MNNYITCVQQDHPKACNEVIHIELLHRGRGWQLSQHRASKQEQTTFKTFTFKTKMYAIVNIRNARDMCERPKTVIHESE